MKKHHPKSSSRRKFLKAGFFGSASLLIPSHDLLAEDSILPNSVIPFDDSDKNWKKIRSQFILDRDVTYMNNASLGMPPSVVVKAVSSGYRSISQEPLHGKHDLQDRISSKVVPSLAKMFGVGEKNMTLTRNASEALYMQTMGVKLKPGDEVLITSQEHPAGSRPWIYRETNEKIKIRYIFIPSPLKTKQDTIDRIINEIGPQTKAISFCHVTRGGHRYPVKEICKEARKRNVLTLVDGAQAVGQFSINLNDLDCDAYSASLHKWILAPSGTGFLYLNERSHDRIRTLFEPEPTDENPGYDPPGTKDFPVRAAILDAVNFVQSIGLGRIESRCRFLSDYLKMGLNNIKGITILSGAKNELSAPGSTIFEKNGLDAIDSVKIIEDKIKTHIDEHQRDGHNAIRISTHIYNTTKQIDRLLNALELA